MPRIAPLSDDQATGQAAELFSAITQKIGKVPNLYRTLGQAPSVLAGLLQLGEVLDGGSLSAPVKEQIALRVANRNGCDTNKAVQDSHEFRHLRHLHALCEQQTDAAADEQCHEQDSVVPGDHTEDRRDQRDRHTDDAVPVTATSGLLVGKTAKGQDKENGRDDIRHGYDSSVNHVDLTS